ncbi:uncharacterized protein LOC105179708 isoform X2 [Sesamum indicum]|uniref:Uncharacterized protein LOC105179708 isoform X2 n=1 Tax=Sesamum indicum TaxID=4182 RepID=A0A8M8UT04_SESIN|nr:uncharacterized protein LOC105179708 isoform X2 [Sesamum indicum]XP_020547064.1 uncharacterized protein LOC105179708 isoform X2 [Sesamum indicum]XP_020547065.1 uncharacterized protein LOC105179708 isoform X2 [Sesamum indicum]XP_020547066.1 uncharacterized protein LOC105179708 isoform X2 [Sesamum indicum]
MTERRWSARRMAANARIAMVSLSHLAEKDYVSALIMTMIGKKIVMTGWILFPKLDLVRRLLMAKNARSFSVTAGPRMQEAFQPGATPAQPGKRHFLCYNMLASITTMEHDGYSHIEINFHDTSSGPRVPAITDYFGFTKASLNESGSVFANPCKGEKNMSTLMYWPFSSWADNSEWSMRLEGEEVRAIALGSAWVAAVTSLNFLRIFNEGGLQIDFHDTSSGPRVPAMTDYFGFSMASLNESGSVFANPCKGEKNMSTLMYWPFSSWADNSEWSMRLEGEEVRAIALGSAWIAAITSLNFLRIFTEGGLQVKTYACALSHVYTFRPTCRVLPACLREWLFKVSMSHPIPLTF